MTDYGERTSGRKDPYRIVMFFKRKKDDPSLRKSTVCLFQDCARTSHIIERMPLYTKIAQELNARAYVTVNARDVRKARVRLQHRLIDTQDADQEETNPVAQCIGSLMESPVRENKLFIIDIDTKDPSTLTLVQNHAPEGHFVETKNGFHYIVPAFDTRLLEGQENIEIKKDGMTVLSWIERFR